jgi:hypothetical protein
MKIHDFRKVFAWNFCADSNRIFASILHPTLKNPPLAAQSATQLQARRTCEAN